MFWLKKTYLVHKGLNKFCKKENYVVPFLQLLLQLETQHLKCYVFVDLNRKLEKKENYFHF